MRNGIVGIAVICILIPAVTGVFSSPTAHEQLVVQRFERLGQLVLDHRPASQRLSDSIAVEGDYDFVAFVTQEMIPEQAYAGLGPLPTAELRLRFNGEVEHVFRPLTGGGYFSEHQVPWYFELAFKYYEFQPGTWTLESDATPREYFTLSTVYGIRGSVELPPRLYWESKSGCEELHLVWDGPKTTFPQELPYDFMTDELVPTLIRLELNAVECPTIEGKAGMELFTSSIWITAPRQLSANASGASSTQRYSTETITNGRHLLRVLGNQDRQFEAGRVSVERSGDNVTMAVSTEDGLLYEYQGRRSVDDIDLSCFTHYNSQIYMEQTTASEASLLRVRRDGSAPCDGLNLDGILQSHPGSTMAQWGYLTNPIIGSWFGPFSNYEIASWAETYMRPESARFLP